MNEAPGSNVLRKSRLYVTHKVQSCSHCLICFVNYAGCSFPQIAMADLLTGSGAVDVVACDLIRILGGTDVRAEASVERVVHLDVRVEWTVHQQLVIVARHLPPRVLWNHGRTIRCENLVLLLSHGVPSCWAKFQNSDQLLCRVLSLSAARGTDIWKAHSKH